MHVVVRTLFTYYVLNDLKTYYSRSKKTTLICLKGKLDDKPFGADFQGQTAETRRRTTIVSYYHAFYTIIVRET